MKTRLLLIQIIFGSPALISLGSIVSRSSVEDKSSNKETQQYSPEALESAYKLLTQIYFRHLTRLIQMDSVVVKDTLCQESNNILQISGELLTVYASVAFSIYCEFFLS